MRRASFKDNADKNGDDILENECCIDALVLVGDSDGGSVHTFNTAKNSGSRGSPVANNFI